MPEMKQYLKILDILLSSSACISAPNNIYQCDFFSNPLLLFVNQTFVGIEFSIFLKDGVDV